jgi:hypothetical protein
MHHRLALKEARAGGGKTRPAVCKAEPMPNAGGIAIYHVVCLFPKKEIAMDASKNIDALAEGVRKQREIAKEAIDATKKIDDILNQTTDPAVREKLKQAKEGFLKVTRDLVANTASTTSAVESTLDLISGLAKR